MTVTSVDAKLDPAQRLAVEYDDGPLIVLAGAGSGKTRVITHRIARRLKQGAAPESVLGVTFTNKAAAEMRERLECIVGDKVASKVQLSTFHSFGVRFLETLNKPFAILDQADSVGLVKELLRRKGLETDRSFDAAAVQARISHFKNTQTRQGDAAVGRDPYTDAADAILDDYQSALQWMHAYDFDDLLLQPTALLDADPGLKAVWQTRIRHIVVDEFQDTNVAQLRLLQSLAPIDADICVVGDDDQSIYSWRGANPENFNLFKAHFKDVKVVALEANYRSNQTILNLANYVIAQSRNRVYPKTLFAGSSYATLELPKFIRAHTADDEAAWVAEQIHFSLRSGHRANEIAVLYRSNALARPLEQALRARGVPYVVYGGTALFDRKEVRDALAYARLLVFTQDEMAMRRIINTPPRGIGEAALSRLADYARLHQVNFNEAARRHESVSDLSSSARAGLYGLQHMLEVGRQALKAGQSPSSVCRSLWQTARLFDRIYNETDNELKRREMDLNAVLGSLESIEKREPQQGAASLRRLLNQMRLGGNDEIETQGHVVLSTLHAAKGLEFRTVFLVGCVEGQLPHQRTIGPKITDPQMLASDHAVDVDEERRLFYVGITRAKEALYLLAPRHRTMRGRTTPLTPTRFMEGCPEDLVEAMDLEVPQSVSYDEAAEMSAAILAQLKQ